MKYTVIIPFFDTIDYIDESLNSLLEQTVVDKKNIQILVINDGSNYDLTSHIEKYKSLCLNVEYHHKDNGNWGSVINYVKKNSLANGDYITILDSDDVFNSNCFDEVEQFLSKNHPDILVGDLAEWKSIRNSKSIRKVLFNFRNRFWNINKHNIFKFKTAFSFPIGKFYKKEIFYSLPDLKEGVSFQDINLYYESLSRAKTYGYINKVLGYRRTDRVGSSTNENWGKRKVDMWVNAIKDMAKYDAVMNALFYTTVKGFRKAYLREYKDRFIIRGKIKTCYIPKWIYLPTYCFIVYLFIRFRKVFKHIH